MPTPVPAPEIVLVDFDDTLVETAPRFRRTRERFFARLAELGFDDATARHVHHHEVDPVVIERYGLGPARIEPAFRETYLALCARARLEPDPATSPRGGRPRSTPRPASPSTSAAASARAASSTSSRRAASTSANGRPRPPTAPPSSASASGMPRGAGWSATA